MLILHGRLFFSVGTPASMIYVQVAVGDVIYIESNSGAVKRVGRSDAFATDLNLRHWSMFHFLNERFIRRRK